VTGVHNDGATVLHEGIIESGSFDRADTVECFVEVSRRTVNSALHSAGHIIDIAVQELGLGWVPGKGYHFPLGPYIEYVGVLKVEDRDTLIKEIERRCRAIVESGGVVSIKINSEDGHDGRAERVVYFGDIGIPCGGTHIANLRDVGCIVIRKIKQEKGNIRVAYSVESH
jgi:Ser-tRNA(Ala) deacylase AlaX